MIQQLPAVTSWGQIVLLLIGAIAGIKWGLPFVMKLFGKNGPNGTEKRTYEAVNKIMDRLEKAENAIKDDMNTGFKDLSTVMQRIEVILGRTRS